MNYSTQDRLDSRERGIRLLEQLKAKEKKIKFHARKIGKNTIVYCKNEDRLDEYEENYNNIKNW